VPLRFRWDGASGPPVVRAVRAGETLTAAPVSGSAEIYTVTLPRLDLFELLSVEPPCYR
jgi:hypothetical protein